MKEETVVAENKDKTEKILVRNEGLFAVVLQQALPNGRTSEKNLEYKLTKEEADKCAEEIAFVLFQELKL